MYELEIQDPSGEIRKLPLKTQLQRKWTISNQETADLSLRDPSLRGNDIHLSYERRGQFWISDSSDVPQLSIGNLSVKSIQWSPQIPIQLGESRLEIKPRAEMGITLPQLPSGTSPWLTWEYEGAKTLWTIKKAASTELSLFLGGETGVGKEILAKIAHLWSNRKGGPFVPINCGALPLSLAESELFGHEKGSFTGAHKSRSGAVLKAHGGTLFLDEIGDLSQEIQVKLLRFLEDGEVKPVGSDHNYHANVRLICATHKPLEELVRQGRFRQDLYYRVASISVLIPPMRDRLEDISQLAIHFAKKFGFSISPKTLHRLQAYHWPGDARELRHAVERAVGFSGSFSSILTDEQFEFLIHPKSEQVIHSFTPSQPILTLKEMEKEMLLKALKITRGNRAKAAKLLGVARSTLFEMIKRHRIQGPRSQIAA